MPSWSHHWLATTSHSHPANQQPFHPSTHRVHRERTKRTSRDKTITAGIKASRTKGLLWLLLLHVVGGHGAIKKSAVLLMVGMVVGLLGESGKLLLTNDNSKKASFLLPRLGITYMSQTHSNWLVILSTTPRDTLTPITTSHTTWHRPWLRQGYTIHTLPKWVSLTLTTQPKKMDKSHVDKGNTSSMAGVLDSPTQSIRTPLVLIDWDDKCGSNH